MEIRAKSAEQAFHLVLDHIKKEGIETSPRGLKIKELINCCITITNPRDRIISCPERKINMAYAFGELCWYLSGRNDLRTMKYYSKFMNKCSDDGETLNSAYGYRIFMGEHPLIPFNQWANAKRLLKEDKDSRQAIIHLHTPNDKKTKDEVCTLSLQFLIRDNKLNMITTMRSNDIVLGFTYDVFAFTMLMEMMANELNVELGTYYHNAGSMHIYENKFSLLEKHTMSELRPMEPFEYEVSDFETLVDIEEEIREYMEIIRVKKISQLRKFEIAEKLKKKIFEYNKSFDNLFKFATFSFIMKACNCLDIRIIQNDILNILRESNENYSDILQLMGRFSNSGIKKIVCGIDGAGKTTLVKNVEKLTRYQTQHYCKPSSQFGFKSNYVYNLQSQCDVIFDRFFVSELIYSKVLERECRIKEEDLREIFEAIPKDKTDFVFIIAKNNEQLLIVKNRLKKEDEHLLDFLNKLNNAYLEFAEMLIEKGFNVTIRSVQE